MRHPLPWQVSAIILLAGVTAGCDKLGIGNKTTEPEAVPTEQELNRISYMSAGSSGPNGRRKYEHLEEAKTCGDLELAMRWNRPPNVAGGVFDTKMVYLTSGIPADLPKDSEVFIAAKIESGDALSVGGELWYLKMADGTRVQAAEPANFWEQQAVVAQDNKLVAIVKPGKPGRAFCGQGVYQGLTGKMPDHDTMIPQVSIMFAMDRDR